MIFFKLSEKQKKTIQNDNCLIITNDVFFIFLLFSKRGGSVFTLNNINKGVAEPRGAAKPSISTSVVIAVEYAGFDGLFVAKDGCVRDDVGNPFACKEWDIRLFKKRRR